MARGVPSQAGGADAADRHGHALASFVRGVEWLDACALADLEPGAPRMVRVGTRHVLLVRHATGVTACEPLCPHKFTPLEEGHVEGDCVVCPTHDAHFGLRDGQPRPGDEWAGTLELFGCRVDADRVQVRL